MKPYTSAFPYFSPSQRAQILAYTQAMLKGEQMLSMGKAVREFEGAFASYCERSFGVATNSCTSALGIVFRELGIGEGDEVIVPTQTFFANASSVLNARAKLRLTDTDKDFMLTYEDVKSALTKRTKAVVVVHFAGLISPDIFQIAALCRQRGIALIEDCSHAHGAIARDSQNRDFKAGSIGDVGVFSFFSTKILPCGEGGMIVCNDEGFARSCRARANRGIDPMQSGEVFICFGENYRMPEFSAIMGLVGLKDLESALAYRSKLATRYKRHLKRLEQAGIVSFQQIPSGFRHSFWRLIVFLHQHEPQEVIKRLRDYHIHADAPYQPLLHKQPIIESCPDSLFLPSPHKTPQNHISLPMHQGIRLKDIDYITHALKEVLS